MSDLTEMIEALDVAARPNVSRVQVMKVGRQIDATVLQERLSKVLKRQQQPQQPQQPPQPQQPQAQPQPVESPTPATILD